MDQSCVTSELINGMGKRSTAVVYLNDNVLSLCVFRELNKILDWIERYQDVRGTEKIDGAIFTSTKNKIFLAGADLYHLKSVLDDKSAWSDRVLETLIQEGQRTFNRIERLKIPTVAAIHGACLGGGGELALACDYRICSNDKSTKIGWPEVQLGILPAWGGCTRLPEIIGTTAALTAILTGKQYAPKPALKIKLIDKIVHRENLLDHAREFAHKEKVINERPFSLIPSSIVFNKAKQNVLAKTKGNYPAPLKILEVLRKGTDGFRSDSFRLEQKAFIELCHTPEMYNLLRVFCLQEGSKKLLVDEQKCARVNNAVVVGAGTMGAGIAQWLSSRGVSVLLKDVTDELIAKGLKSIGDLYVQGVLGHKMNRPTARDGIARITTSTTDISLHNKDIVIEAIVENLSVKQKVLAQLEEQLPDDAIIATNTSALSIDEMASCLKRPERFIGIHFFNPVHKMKLVEVVKGSKTDDITVKRAVEFVQQIGKLPVIVKDSPGFVVNRILVPYLIKSAEMLDSGPQMEAIDSAMVKFGMPMGPFRLMDEIGLDVCYHVADDLRSRLDLQCSLDELAWRISRGELGKKTGKGFYEYKKGRPVKNKIKEKVDVSVLVQSMTDEAHKVIHEDVVEDPDMIDFAMIMGTGWAPFRGGPMKYHSSHIVPK